VVDSAEREVVVLVGVPLKRTTASVFDVHIKKRPRLYCKSNQIEKGITHGISDGVSGLEPGGGRLMKVGVCVCAMATVD
jgi:hypothetical protein